MKKIKKKNIVSKRIALKIKEIIQQTIIKKICR